MKLYREDVLVVEELKEALQAIQVIDVGEGDMVVIQAEGRLSITERSRLESWFDGYARDGFKGRFLILDSGYKIAGVIRNKK